MKKNLYGLLTFQSTHAAMTAQKMLTNINFQVMPTLRIISASCGISLKIEEQNISLARQTLLNGDMPKEMFSAYLIFDDDGKMGFEAV